MSPCLSAFASGGNAGPGLLCPILAQGFHDPLARRRSHFDHGVSQIFGHQRRLKSRQAHRRFDGGSGHLGVRVEQCSPHQLGPFAFEIAEGASGLGAHLGRRVVKENLERSRGGIGLLDGHHAPQRRGGHAPGGRTLGGRHRQILHLGRIDKAGVNGKRGGAQPGRGIGRDGLFEGGAERIGHLSILAQEREGRNARLLGRALVGGDLRKRRHRLAWRRGRDLIEQRQSRAARLAVAAAERLANRNRGRHRRTGGQIENPLLGQTAEGCVLVGDGDGEDARRGGWVETRALVENRAAHDKGRIRQGRAQDGGVGALALPAIDGGGHLDATPTHLGRLIVEGGGQDFILARAAGPDHGQRLQGLAAQSGIRESLFERNDAGGIAEQHQRDPARHRPEPVEHRAQPDGDGCGAILVERAGGAARGDAAGKFRGHAGRCEAGVGENGAEARTRGQEIQEGQTAAPPSHHHAAARRILGRLERQRVGRAQFEHDAQEDGENHHQREARAQHSPADAPAQSGRFVRGQLADHVRPYVADFEQGERVFGEHAPAQDAARFLDLRGGDGRVIANARHQARMGQGEAIVALAGRLAQDAACDEHRDGLLHRRFGQLGAHREHRDGQPLAPGAREQEPRRCLLARIDDGAMEESVQDGGGAAGAFVAAQGGQALLDRRRGDDLQIGGQARTGPAQIGGHQIGEPGLEEGSGIERGLFENLGDVRLVEPRQLHPAAGRGRDAGDFMDAFQPMKQRRVDAEKNTQATAGTRDGGLEQGGERVEGRRRNVIGMVVQQIFQVIEDEQRARGRRARHAHEIIGRAVAGRGRLAPHTAQGLPQFLVEVGVAADVHAGHVVLGQHRE